MPRPLTSSRTAQDQEIAQLVHHSFYKLLSEPQRRLVRTSIALYLEERRQGLRYPDYGFVVFSMSKAYEGFLKEYLYTTGLLDSDGYFDRKLRIGRALNPDVSPRQRDANWFYDDLAQVCSPEVARQVWNAWLECRNQLFHYFPGKETATTLLFAGERILQLARAMQVALRCEQPQRP